MSETYTVVVSAEDTFTDEALDNVVASMPEVTAWHRSPLCPKGQSYLIAETRLQRAMQEVLSL